MQDSDSHEQAAVPPLELRRLGFGPVWRPDGVRMGQRVAREQRSCGTHPTDESRSLIRSRIRGTQDP